MPDRHFSAGALFSQTTEPQTVPSGTFWLYPKSDGQFYIKPSGGSELAIGQNRFLPLAGGSLSGTLLIAPQQNTSIIVGSGFVASGTNASPMIDLSGVWNTTGTPTAIRLNLTDTASNSSSLLMNFQIGGSSILSVDKNSNTAFAAPFSRSYRPFIANDRTNRIFDIDYNGQVSPTTTGDPGYIFRIGQGGFNFYTRPAGSSTNLNRMQINASDGINLNSFCLFRNVNSEGAVNLVIQGFDDKQTLQQFRIQQYTAGFGGFSNSIGSSSAAVTAYSSGTIPGLHVYSSSPEVDGTFLNYVRAALSASSSSVTLRAETAGTGEDNLNLNLIPAGTGQVFVSGQLAVSSGINIPSLVPSTTTNRLYSNGGTLYFNGQNYSPSIISSIGTNNNALYYPTLVIGTGSSTAYMDFGLSYNPDTNNLSTVEATLSEITMSQVIIGEIDRLSLTDCDNNIIIGLEDSSNSYGPPLGNGSLCYDNIVIGNGAGFNTSTTSYSNFIGNEAGSYSDSSSYSNFIGYLAGVDASGSSFSNFIGNSAGSYSDSSFSNFIGYSAGSYSDSSTYSNFIGYSAGSNTDSSTYSNFIGYSAGYDADNSTYSNFIGYLAGSNADNSNYSNFIGTEAGANATNVFHSNFIGSSAGYNADNSNYSNFIGYLAGVDASNSYHSNFIGVSGGYDADDCYHSNFIGDQAGYNANNSYHSNFIGVSAGYDADSSYSSNFIGYFAGYNADGSNYSNFIGYQAGRSCTGNRNIEIVTEGPNSSILGSNSNKLNIQQTIMGDLSSKRIAIGSGVNLSPAATLHVMPAINTPAVAISGVVASGTNNNGFIDMSGVWNTTGTPTAIKLNVTDTASNSSSLFADFRKNNVTRFSVSKEGALYASGNISTSGDIFFAKGGNVSPVGLMSWDDGEGTVSIGLKGGNVTLNVGQENIALCYNGGASQLTRGQVVYIAGAQGLRPKVGLSIASGEFTSSKTFGVVAEPINSGNEGFVTNFGLVRHLNTSSFGEGSGLWLSPTISGGMTMTRPQAPYHGVFIGYCVRSHAHAGEIFVTIQNGYEIQELHNVSITNIADGDILQYDSSLSLWKNVSGGGAGISNEQSIINALIFG